jgi:hypothetical protein
MLRMLGFIRRSTLVRRWSKARQIGWRAKHFGAILFSNEPFSYPPELRVVPTLHGVPGAPVQRNPTARR